MRQENTDFTPVMLSIPEASKRSGLSQYSLRKMVEKNEIAYFRIGVKVYINYDLLLAMLNDPIRVGKLSASISDVN